MMKWKQYVWLQRPIYDFIYDELMMNLRLIYDEFMMNLWWIYDEFMMYLWWIYDELTNLWGTYDVAQRAKNSHALVNAE